MYITVYYKHLRCLASQPHKTTYLHTNHFSLYELEKKKLVNLTKVCTKLLHLHKNDMGKKKKERDKKKLTLT